MTPIPTAPDFSTQAAEALVESIQDAVIRASRDGIVHHWNRAATRLLGYEADEIVGQSLAMLCPAERAHEETCDGAAARDTPAGRPQRTVRLHRDGTRIAVSVTRMPIVQPDGRVIGRVVVMRDDRPSIEAGERMQQLASIITHSDDAIVTKTLAGIVTSWNPGAERIFGWTADEIIGRPMTAVIPEERHGEETQILARIAAGEKVDHFETERLRKDGSTVQVSVTISPLLDGHGNVVGASKIARDIGVRVQAERVIQHHASTDAVTGLPNRRAFGESLAAVVERAYEERSRAALLVVDLDRFKAVNDSLGHAVGDKLLRQASRRLKHCVRHGDIVARLGGDEFTVVLPAVSSVDEVMAVGNRICSELARAFEIDGRKVQIGGSVGIAVFPDDGQTPALLVQHADEAMCSSKRAGGSRAERLSPAQRAAARDRAQLLSDLRQAVAMGQLSVAYQPVVDLATNVVGKVEALARWRHPTRGPIGPDVFIPLAEGAGLLRQIGDWVFREASRQAAIWRRRHGPQIQVSINLSPKQLLAGPEYFAGWERHLRELSLPGSALVLEITEDMLVDRSDRTAALLARIRAQGLDVAVDDFGTGYSNLSTLSRLDVQYLKIDRSFVNAIVEADRGRAMCRAITAMGHSMGMKVVAEGIETEAQAAFLREVGCDFGQGFHFSAPKTAAEVEHLLMQRWDEAKAA